LVSKAAQIVGRSVQIAVNATGVPFDYYGKIIPRPVDNPFKRICGILILVTEGTGLSSSTLRPKSEAGGSTTGLWSAYNYMPTSRLIGGSTSSWLLQERAITIPRFFRLASIPLLCLSLNLCDSADDAAQM
jgi:hypothetical protein